MLRRRRFLLGLLAAPAALLSDCGDGGRRGASSVVLAEEELPPPDHAAGEPVWAVVARRRSVRTFTADVLTRAQVGQLLWAAQGVTAADGKRAAPSAGSLYPLELCLVDSVGVHRYVAAGHRLATVAQDDRRAALVRACRDQQAVALAPAAVVVAGVAARTATRYGSRAERYVTLEAGHVTHALLLAATALGLGAVPIGSFDDDAVARVATLPPGARPLYVVPLGVAG